MVIAPATSGQSVGGLTDHLTTDSLEEEGEQKQKGGPILQFCLKMISF